MGSLVRHSVALASCRTLSCRGLRWTVPTVWWSKLLEFSWTLCWGSFLLLPVFADSSGWLSDNPWLSALRCLTAGGVTLVFWVPRSCGVHGLRDGVTCLRSGLWSSSVRYRNEDFPPFGGFGSYPSCGVPYLRLALCSSACVSPGGCPSFSQVGPAHSRWVPLLWTWCVWGLQPFTSPVYSFGMWSLYGSVVSFCHS